MLTAGKFGQKASLASQEAQNQDKRHSVPINRFKMQRMKSKQEMITQKIHPNERDQKPISVYTENLAKNFSEKPSSNERPISMVAQKEISEKRLDEIISAKIIDQAEGSNSKQPHSNSGTKRKLNIVVECGYTPPLQGMKSSHVSPRNQLSKSPPDDYDEDPAL